MLCFPRTEHAQCEAPRLAHHVKKWAAYGQKDIQRGGYRQSHAL